MSRLVTVGTASALVMVLGAGSSVLAQEGDIAVARGLVKDKRYKEAIVEYTKLIKARGNMVPPVLYFERGNANAALTPPNFPGAEADYSEAIKIRNTTVEPFFNRGIIRTKTNNWAGALDDFSKVIELNPKPRAGATDFVLESRENRVAAYVSLNKFAEAIKDAEVVLAADPKRGYVLLNRAFAYEKLNQFDKAVADYGASVALLPTDAEKASAYFSKAEIEYLQLKQLQPAVDDYTKGLAINKNDLGALLNRAACLFELNKASGNMAGVLADYNAALAIKPGDGDILKNRAAVHLQLKDYKSAIVDYSAYLQKAGASADVAVYRLRAVCYLNVDPKNYAGAVGDLKTYLAKNDKEGVAWKDLAVAQYNIVAPPGTVLDKTKGAALADAIASATKATQLDPKQADAYIILGESYSSQEKYKEAVAPYTSYIALAPDKPFGYEGLGRVQYNLQDYKGAIPNFEKYLKLKSTGPESAEIKKLLALAKANGGGGSPAEKITALTEAIEADPKDPGAYTNRGVAYFEMQNYDKAIADFKKSLELIKPTDENYLKYTSNLASAAYSKASKSKVDADYKMAADVYTQWLAKAPNNAEVLLTLGEISLNLKQWDNAIANYTKYLATNPTDAKNQQAVLTNRAYCALQKMPPDLPGAIADYSKLITMSPMDPKLYELRGRAYLDMKNLAMAAADFEKVSQLSATKDPDLTKQLAIISFNLGEAKRKANDPTKGSEFEKAIAGYTTYLATKAGDASALYGRGLAIYRKAKAATDTKIKLAELKKAIADFEEATKADPKNADAWYYLGLACDDSGVADELAAEDMFPKAIAAYEKYIALPGVPAADVEMTKKRIAQLKEAL